MVRNRRSTQISLMERKTVTNLLGFAQQSHREAEGIPSDIYRLPLSDFEKMMGVKLNNRPHLLKVLNSISSMKVDFDDSLRGALPSNGDPELIPRGKESLVGVANIIAEIYLDTDTKEIVFSLPAKARNRLLRPEHFNRLQNMVLNQFTSHAGMVLFEYVSAYFTSPGRRTPSRHWSDLSVALSGSSEPHSTYRDFSKMLARAVEQVNSIIANDGYFIVTHSTVVNKRTEELWFEIQPPKQASLGLQGSPMAMSGEVHSRLTELGIKTEIISDLVMRHGEEYVLAQYDYVIKRSRNTKLEKLTNPKAFFMTAIEQNYADAPRQTAEERESKQKEKADLAAKSKAKASKEAPSKAVNSIKDAWLKSRRAALQATFEALPKEERSALVSSLEDELRASHKAVLSFYKKHGADHELVKRAVIDIQMSKESLEPTTEQLLEFAMSSGMLNLGNVPT